MLSQDLLSEPREWLREEGEAETGVQNCEGLAAFEHSGVSGLETNGGTGQGVGELTLRLRIDRLREVAEVSAAAPPFVHAWLCPVALCVCCQLSWVFLWPLWAGPGSSRCLGS